MTTTTSPTPTHAHAERLTLGAILARPSVLADVSPIVGPGDFACQHWGIEMGTIYQAILDLAEEDGKISETEISEKIEESTRAIHEETGEGEVVMWVDSIPAINILRDSMPAPSAAPYYARMVREYALARELATLGVDTYHGGCKAQTGATVEHAADRIDEIKLQLEQIGGGIDGGIKDLLQGAFQTIEKLQETGDGMTGTPTGFAALDRLTAGMQPSDLIILGARPSMGKTAIATQIAMNAAEHGKGAVVIISLEMSKEALTFRMLGSRARVDGNEIRTGQLRTQSIPKLTHAAGELSRMPLFIQDPKPATVANIRRACLGAKAKHGGLALVVVDYLGYMSSERDHDHEESKYAEFSHGLKMMAKDLDCPVLALSQLNRGLEKRPDKRPQMSDLRYSGALEQDADLIIFLYRDEVYHEDTDDRGIAEIIIRKQRNGAIGTVRLRFDAPTTRFHELCAGEV